MNGDVYGGSQKISGERTRGQHSHHHPVKSGPQLRRLLEQRQHQKETDAGEKVKDPEYQKRIFQAVEFLDEQETGLHILKETDLLGLDA